MSTQRPAAPETETDASGLTEALHRAFHDHWDSPTKPLDLYADSPLWQTQAAAVERIVAERLRVVEGERDALKQQVLDEWATLVGRTTTATARAESAEAAHAALVAGVEALAADFDTAVGFRGAATSLRALLAGGGA